MRFPIDNTEISASVRRIKGNRARLTIDYPSEPHNWDRIMDALKDLLNVRADDSFDQEEELTHA